MAIYPQYFSKYRLYIFYISTLAEKLCPKCIMDEAKLKLESSREFEIRHQQNLEPWKFQVYQNDVNGWVGDLKMGGVLKTGGAVPASCLASAPPTMLLFTIKSCEVVLWGGSLPFYQLHSIKLICTLKLFYNIAQLHLNYYN